MKIEVLRDDMLWWLLNTDILVNVLPIPSVSSNLGCETSMMIRIFNLWKTSIV